MNNDNLVKKIDPQVQSFLEQLQLANSGEDINISSFSEKIASMRASIQAMIPLGGLAEPVFNVRDTVITDDGVNIPIRLYTPVDTEELLPAFVYYHGGGFQAGNLDSHDIMLRALANRSACIIIAVDYRLAPEHPFPAAPNDAWSVLKWVADHGNEIGADAERLAVGGDSAGGCLAAGVALRAVREGILLSLQILLNPILDATTSSASWKELGTGEYLVSLDTMKEWFDNYLPEKADRKDSLISPLFADDLAGVASALIITAEFDPLRDEGDAYAARLQAENIAVAHICFPGMIHGFASLAGIIDAGKTVIDLMGNSLRKAFEIKF